ncbi:hypothetical protein MTO96_038515, partial [Rhipicephalus appendiculatus]
MLSSITSSVPDAMARRLIQVSLLLCAGPPGVLSVYYGKSLGDIKQFAHGFTGTVYVANDTSVVITGLNYDGKGPAAFFWASYTTALDNKADQLLDEYGSDKVLKPYKNAKVRLTLTKQITEYKSFGIYCKKFGADFGNVQIPAGYELPKEQSLGPLAAKQHNTKAAEVVLKDSETMLLKQFEFDATTCAGSAFFVAAPSANPQPDQLTHLMYDNGKTTKLERYDKVDVTITLPDGKSWNDFQWFSVYCLDSKQSYADIAIDKTLAEKLPLPASTMVMHGPSANTPNAGFTMGPLSVITLFSLSVAIATTAVTTLQCL